MHFRYQRQVQIGVVALMCAIRHVYTFTDCMHLQNTSTHIIWEFLTMCRKTLIVRNIKYCSMSLSHRFYMWDMCENVVSKGYIHKNDHYIGCFLIFLWHCLGYYHSLLSDILCTDSNSSLLLDTLWCICCVVNATCFFFYSKLPVFMLTLLKFCGEISTFADMKSLLGM